MKKTFSPGLIAAAGLALLICSSCATVVTGFRQKIHVYSEPDSAQVFLNGRNTNLITPCDVKIPRRVKPSMNNKKNEPFFVLKKEGYEDFEVKSSKKFNPFIFGNVVFFVTPFVLPQPGASSDDLWYPLGTTAPVAAGAVIDLLTGSVIRYDKNIFARMTAKPVFNKTALANVKNAEATSGGGLALCIGNGNYVHGGILANPENDAGAIAEALTRLGYKVMLYRNIGQNEMKRAIDEFGSELKNYTVGLFFYAGHGIQSKGVNYLIPVDARITSESDVEYTCVDAGRVLGKMEGAGSKTNIIILDACRNNPFERSWTRSTEGKGLAVMDAPIGSLIGFATSPGSTASDGSGKNGLYTSAILSTISEPGITIIELFQRVRKIVRESSEGKQVPWESTSLEGNYYFKK